MAYRLQPAVVRGCPSILSMAPARTAVAAPQASQRISKSGLPNCSRRAGSPKPPKLLHTYNTNSVLDTLS